VSGDPLRYLLSLFERAILVLIAVLTVGAVVLELVNIWQRGTIVISSSQ
jgi:hypothetical protein